MRLDGCMNMRKSHWAGLFIILLAGCGSAAEAPPPTASAPDAPATTTETLANSAPAEPAAATPDRPIAERDDQSSATPALAPDRYCYVIDSPTLTGAVRLRVDAAAQIKGDSVVSIHNDESGYYSSYAQKFTGDLVGDRAELTVMTWIEYDLQEVDETWQLTPTTLTVNNDVFTAADCEDPAVANYFIGPDGLDSETLLMDLPPAQRVQFASGTSQTTLENSVVRGDRDVYQLGAQGGQQMTLRIASLEDNAVFDVISPSGTVMAREALDESLVLPQTGDYTVIVGGTRGNATYTLDIAIN